MNLTKNLAQTRIALTAVKDLFPAGALNLTRDVLPVVSALSLTKDFIPATAALTSIMDDIANDLTSLDSALKSADGTTPSTFVATFVAWVRQHQSKRRRTGICSWRS